MKSLNTIYAQLTLLVVGAVLPVLLVTAYVLYSEAVNIQIKSEQTVVEIVTRVGQEVNQIESNSEHLANFMAHRLQGKK